MDNLRFKFRFWHNEYKKMVEVFNFGIDGGCCEWVQHSPIYNTEDGLPILDNWGGVMEEPSKIIRRSKLIDGVLEQCTGVKDKNGKLVYENDIIEITSPVYDHYNSKPRLNKNIQVVKWRENQTGFYPFCYGIHQEYEETTFEVIGNVHENKELLKNEDR